MDGSFLQRPLDAQEPSADGRSTGTNFLALDAQKEAPHGLQSAGAVTSQPAGGKVSEYIRRSPTVVNPDPARSPKRRGIATTYKGVQFRSRLEAAWAAFFDELRLPWEYEPLDLDGYIPDFLIKFATRPLLVEIKPAREDFEIARLKLDASGWSKDAVILTDASTRFVGDFLEQEGLPEDALGMWDRAVLASCLECRGFTIVSEAGRWDCRTCGAGNRALWWAYNPNPAWVAAKNMVQWRAPG